MAVGAVGRAGAVVASGPGTVEVTEAADAAAEAKAGAAEDEGEAPVGPVIRNSSSKLISSGKNQSRESERGRACKVI